MFENIGDNRIYFSKDDMLGNHNGLYRIYWHSPGNYYTHSISKKVDTDDVFRYVEFKMPLMYLHGGKVYDCIIPMFVGKKVPSSNPGELSASFNRVYVEIVKRNREQDNGKPYDADIGLDPSVPVDIMRVVKDILRIYAPNMPKCAADIDAVCIDRYLVGRLT